MVSNDSAFNEINIITNNISGVKSFKVFKFYTFKVTSSIEILFSRQVNMIKNIFYKGSFIAYSL